MCNVAARIKGCLREVDTVARLGGDEFAITEAGKPYGIDAHRIEIGVSIGIAAAVAESTAETLLKAAGRATYRFARRDGGASDAQR